MKKTKEEQEIFDAGMDWARDNHNCFGVNGFINGVEWQKKRKIDGIIITHCNECDSHISSHYCGNKHTICTELDKTISDGFNCKIPIECPKRSK